MSVRAKVTQAELNTKLKKHADWLAGINGGERLLLQYSDCAGLQFLGDLTRAVFDDCDLSLCRMNPVLLTETKFSGGTLKGSQIKAIGNFPSFDSISLEGVDFTASSLEPVWFSRCNFKNTVFSHAKIHGNFTEADLSETTVDNADFGQSSFKEIVFPKNLDQTRLFRCYFSDCDLSGVDFTGATESRDVEFYGCKLQGANLTGVNFSVDQFSSRFVVNSDFTSAKLDSSDFSGMEFRKCTFSKATMQGVKMNGSILEQVDLSGKDLSKAEFKSARLYKASLKNCNLTDADCRNAHMSRAQLQSANLTNTIFYSADLTFSNYLNAILSGTKFNLAVLRGATNENGDTCNVHSVGACYT